MTSTALPREPSCPLDVDSRPPPLQRVPIELILNVLEYLPVSDLRNVRLTSHSLSTKASPILFRTVQLPEKPTDLLQSPIAPHIRHLKITTEGHMFLVELAIGKLANQLTAVSVAGVKDKNAVYGAQEMPAWHIGCLQELPALTHLNVRLVRVGAFADRARFPRLKTLRITDPAKGSDFAGLWRNLQKEQVWLESVKVPDVSKEMCEYLQAYPASHRLRALHFMDITYAGELYHYKTKRYTHEEEDRTQLATLFWTKTLPLHADALESLNICADYIGYFCFRRYYERMQRASLVGCTQLRELELTFAMPKDVEYILEAVKGLPRLQELRLSCAMYKQWDSNGGPSSVMAKQCTVAMEWLERAEGEGWPRLVELWKHVESWNRQEESRWVRFEKSRGTGIDGGAGAVEDIEGAS